MSPRRVLAPAIVSSLLNDPDVLTALDFPPHRPCHERGAAVPGCTEWPANWDGETIDRNVQAATRLNWSCRFRGYEVYRQRIDGTLVCAIVRGGKVVVAFPELEDEYVEWNPRQANLLTETVERMRAVLSMNYDDHSSAWFWTATELAAAGEYAEAAIWFLEIASFLDIVFAEDVFINLYLLALHGHLKKEARIAELWSDAYPTTWGLTLNAPKYETVELDLMVGAFLATKRVEKEAVALLDELLGPRAKHFHVIKGDKHTLRSVAGRWPETISRTFCPADPESTDDGDSFKQIWSADWPGDPRGRIAVAAVLAGVQRTRWGRVTLGGNDIDVLRTYLVPDAVAAMREVDCA